MTVALLVLADVKGQTALCCPLVGAQTAQLGCFNRDFTGSMLLILLSLSRYTETALMPFKKSNAIIQL